MKRRYTIQDKAFIALKKAVREVVEHHKKTGRPLAVWRDNKVTWIPATQLLRKSQ